jgi:hypothetical protein
LNRRLDRLGKMAVFRHFFSLAQPMLFFWHRGFFSSGRNEMAKFETYGMAIGLFLTGIITFAALPLA